MTDAELAILSIVAEGPIHGYNIQTLIVRRGLRAWTNIGVSSMYYVLEKLERQGLIESGSKPQHEGASRREYRITPAGFGVLQTAVADLLGTPRHVANGFELGLANLHVLRPSQIRNALTGYREELRSRLTQARERWQQARESSVPHHVDALFDHQVAMLEAELAWLTAFFEAWESRAPAEEPAPAPEPADVPRMRQVVLPHDPDSPHRAETHLHTSGGTERDAHAADSSVAATQTSRPTARSAAPPVVPPLEDESAPDDTRGDS